ncbi:hypothetical protein [Comamonas sp. MYb396]|uniref:hypothetical protein n=1 Tax=Comamonas sp. MYb396 TaxID=2745302 RepID=UPI0030AF3C14
MSTPFRAERPHAVRCIKTIALAILCAHSVANAQVFEVAIDAKSNIFYGGTDRTPPTNQCTNVNGLGDGLYPPHIALNPGLRSLQISSYNSANLSYANGYPRAPTPDGIYHGASSATTSTNPSGTMPGLRFANRMGMLAAVFTDDTIVNSSSNVSLSTFDSSSMNAAVMDFGLRDTFYLGDGTVVDWPTQGGLPDGTQQRQTITTPDGATKLYLGLTDAYGINGPNRCFMDNTGQIVATLKMTISDDSGAVVQGVGGVAIADVKANDYVTAQSDLISVKPVAPPLNSTEGAEWPSGIVLNANGSVSVSPSVPAGEYKAWYELCDASTTPQSCMQALVTINVGAAPLLVIDANPDSGAVTQSLGGTAITDIRKNDALNGNMATAAATTVTPQGVWPSGISLNTATGSVGVAAGTPVGTYSMQYRLCEAARPSNCDVSTVTVVVTADAVLPIKALDDDATAVTVGFSGTVIESVLTNDTLNSSPANLSNSTVQAEGAWPIGISLDPATGSVLVASNATVGNYQLPYRLCEIANPSNCDTAYVHLLINAAIVPVAAPTPVPSNTAWSLMLLALGLALMALRAGAGKPH